LLAEVERLNDGARPGPVSWADWLAKPEREPSPAPVARPRRRARAQSEPSEPREEPAFEPKPGESYEAALQRLLGDESAERFAARVAELADQEPADAAATRQPKPEPAKPEPWWGAVAGVVARAALARVYCHFRALPRTPPPAR
jgi:hypothetical protein